MPQVRIHVTEKLADFASYIFVRHGFVARFDCYAGALLSNYGEKDVNTAKKKTYVYIYTYIYIEENQFSIGRLMFL